MSYYSLRSVAGLSLVLLFLVIVDCRVLSQITAEDDAQSTSESERKNVKTSAALFEEGRKKKKEEEGMMTKMLPMMVIPFVISTAMIPMSLISLKFMLVQSFFVGKIALILLLINMFRQRSNQGGVFSHNVHEKEMPMSMAHYGYSGDEEYGAYVNRRKRTLG